MIYLKIYKYDFMSISSVVGRTPGLESGEGGRKCPFPPLPPPPQKVC